jgi:hypothetical protein
MTTLGGSPHLRLPGAGAPEVLRRRRVTTGSAAAGGHRHVHVAHGVPERHAQPSLVRRVVVCNCGGWGKKGGNAPGNRRCYSDAKVANRDGRGFGWGIAHAAVSQRPPISLDTIVARTRMYTYGAKVWDPSIVQGPKKTNRAFSLLSLRGRTQ